MALNIKYIALSGGGVLTVCGVAAGMSYLPKGKSMRQKLMDEGKELMKFTKEFPVVFGIFKDDGELIKLINTGDPEITIGSTLEIGGAALKNWCNKNLKNYQSDAKIRTLLERYCTEPPTTIEEKLKKKGRKPVSNWKNKLTSIKESEGKEDLLKAIKGDKQTPATLDAEGAENSLKDWCDANKKKQLSEAQANNLEKGVNDRCFNQ